jgi:hypothetical protein
LGKKEQEAVETAAKTQMALDNPTLNDDAFGS